MLDLMVKAARQTKPGVAEYLLRGIVALEYLSVHLERHGQDYMAAALGAPMEPVNGPGGAA